MEFSRRIGVSTDSFYDISLDEAIDLLQKAEFGTFEIIPADYMGAGGYPYSALNPGMWMRDFGQSQRRELRKKLGCFDLVTVHAPHLGINVNSRNPGIAEESIRQCIECFEFAHDIGSRMVTFHNYGLEFARIATRYAHQYDVQTGYENGPASGGLIDTIEEIDDGRFGLLIDVGHTVNGHHDPAKLIEENSDKLVEVHISGGVYRSEHRFPIDGWGMDHFPFELNDGVDYPSIVNKLDKVGYQGPIILEICYARYAHEIIEYCKRAKQELVSIHDRLHSAG